MNVLKVFLLVSLLILPGCSSKGEDKASLGIGLPRVWLLNENIYGLVVDAESCAEVLAAPGTSQNYRICRPVPGATVELDIASGGILSETVTDEKGRFFFPRRTKRQIMSYSEGKENAFPGGQIRVSAKDYWMIEVPAKWESGQTEKVVRRTEPVPYNPHNGKRHIAVILGPTPR